MEGACKLDDTSSDMKAKQDISDKASMEEEETQKRNKLWEINIAQ